MSRLIDADDLKRRLWEKSKAQHNIPLVEHDFRELIEEAPTVDAVEVGKAYPREEFEKYGLSEWKDKHGQRWVMIERTTDEHK